MYAESHSRSFVKGLSWRVLGTLDTIAISYLLYGKLDASFTIGGIEFFTKLILYYLHERAWTRIRKLIRNLKLLYVFKAVSWRLVGTLDTIMIAFFVTGSFHLAFSIGSVELITKVFLYYIHEYIWGKVSWGNFLEQK